MKPSLPSIPYNKASHSLPGYQVIGVGREESSDLQCGLCNAVEFQPAGLFLALYDSVILLKHVVLLLSRSKSTRGQWRRMLTSEGMRCIWKSFLLDAYKQVSCAPGASPQGCRGREAEMLEGTRCLQELRGELSGALSGGRKVMLGSLLSTPVPRSRT